MIRVQVIHLWVSKCKWRNDFPEEPFAMLLIWTGATDGIWNYYIWCSCHGIWCDRSVSWRATSDWGKLRFKKWEKSESPKNKQTMTARWILCVLRCIERWDTFVTFCNSLLDPKPCFSFNRPSTICGGYACGTARAGETWIEVEVFSDHEHCFNGTILNLTWREH